MLAYAAKTAGHGMKTLYVLRHGQADPESEASSDYERQLTKRGRSEARHSAQYLSERPNVPSLILASGAARARETAELCLAALPSSPQLTLLDGLYLAEPVSYLAALADRAEPHATVLVVGHNPGLEALIHLLTDRSEHLATASLIEIALAIRAWSDLSPVAPGFGRTVSTFRA
jgi:phosphohistidine phosphatase